MKFIPMSQENKKIGVIIMAAGHGTRMKSTTPKVMTLLSGTPLIGHIVDAIEDAGCFDAIVVIVNSAHTLVQDYLGDRATYVVQAEQLGTGHAVSCAEDALRDVVDHVVVLNGDMPFITGKSLKKLVDRQIDRDNTITLMTAIVDDFFDWRTPFANFARIVRGVDGHITQIIERKDATDAQSKIKEINPSYFCFKADWLWSALKNISNHNAQGEYYVTDLIKLAIADQEKISSIDIHPEEIVGINTPEDLAIAEELFMNKLK